MSTSRQPVLGVTKCPECRRPLDGHPIFVRDVEEYPWRTSPSGKLYRSITPVRVQQRWHQTCWTRITRDVERNRLSYEVHRWEDLIAMAETAGVPVSTSSTASLTDARAALAAFDAANH